MKIVHFILTFLPSSSPSSSLSSSSSLQMRVERLFSPIINALGFALHTANLRCKDSVRAANNHRRLNVQEQNLELAGQVDPTTAKLYRNLIQIFHFPRRVVPLGRNYPCIKTKRGNPMLRINGGSAFIAHWWVTRRTQAWFSSRESAPLQNKCNIEVRQAMLQQLAFQREAVEKNGP